jgi:hypothetical protein
MASPAVGVSRAIILLISEVVGCPLTALKMLGV